MRRLPHVAWDPTGTPIFFHECADRVTSLRLTADRWKWDLRQNTVTPSIHCEKCSSHGVWTSGEWRPV